MRPQNRQGLRYEHALRAATFERGTGGREAGRFDADGAAVECGRHVAGVPIAVWGDPHPGAGRGGAGGAGNYARQTARGFFLEDCGGLMSTDILPGFPDDDAVHGASESARGIFSGRDLERHEPERYRRVVELIMDGGLSQRQVAAVTRTSRNTVAAVCKHLISTGAIEPAKRSLAAAGYTIAALSTDRMAEILTDPIERKRVRFRDLVIGAAVMIDKAQLLAGEATSRMEVVEGPRHEDMDRMYRAAVIEAECIERPAQMDCGGEISGKGAGPAARAGAATGPDQATARLELGAGSEGKA